MRKPLANNPTHVSTGNVFKDLGFPPEKALALKFKAKILTGILDEVNRKKYHQGQVVDLLDEHQPVVSNLLQGKISQMSIEKLLVYADRLGLKLDIHRAPAPRPKKRATHSAARTIDVPKIVVGKIGGKAGGKIGGKRI